MAWTTIDITDLNACLNAPEITSLKQVQLVAGQTDPALEAINNSIELVRGYVRAYSGNIMAATGIPAELVSTAVSIAIYLLSKRLPLPEKRQEKITKDYEDAISLLKDVAKGSFKLTQDSAETVIKQYGYKTLTKRVVTDWSVM
jgi:phage gp36-like protein